MKNFFSKFLIIFTVFSFSNLYAETLTSNLLNKTSKAITFNGTCGGSYGASHGITPEAPTITNTFQ